MQSNLVIHTGAPGHGHEPTIPPYKQPISTNNAALHASCSMSSCSICLDSLQSPYSLPCGHVFCYQCLARTHSALPHTTQHHCPTCRNHYSIVNLSPAFVPEHLRPFITPSVRKIYLNDCIHSAHASSSDPENLRLAKEISALKTLCVTWRKRAEMHSSATLGLLSLAKMARNHSLQLKRENEELVRKYEALKRKVGATEEEQEEEEQLPPLDEDEMPKSSLLLRVDEDPCILSESVGLKRRRHRIADGDDASSFKPEPPKRIRLES